MLLYIDHVENGKNDFLVDFCDKAAVQQAVLCALQKELSPGGQTLDKTEKIDAMDIVRKHVGIRRPPAHRAAGIHV